MNEQIESLDNSKYVGSVTLTNGEKLYCPKISMGKIIKLVKFIGIDLTKLYNELSDILMDTSYIEVEKITVILETLDEKQLIHIFSILLEKEDEETLELDVNEMLDIAIVYADTNIIKTFTQVRQLYKKIYGKPMPSFQQLMDKWFPVEETAEQPNVEPVVKGIHGQNRNESTLYDQLEQLIDTFIAQIEFVSSHFRYEEEYVLSHSPAWLNRKFKQAQRESWNKSHERIMEGFKSIAVFIDGALNKGRNMNKLLPSFEQGQEPKTKAEKQNEQFVTEKWW